MIVINQERIQEIKAAIESLAEEFRQAPGMLLNEDDLKYHLMAKLTTIANFNDPQPSADRWIQATAVHAEVPWFSESNRLSLRPDITITDPENLSIIRPMQDGIAFPRKGVHFVGDSVIFELKFYKGREGVDQRALVKIRRDIEKIQRLIRRNQEINPSFSLYGFIVVFSRYSPQCNQLTELAEQTYNHLQLIIRSADLRLGNNDIGIT